MKDQFVYWGLSGKPVTVTFNVNFTEIRMEAPRTLESAIARGLMAGFKKAGVR